MYSNTKAKFTTHKLASCPWNKVTGQEYVKWKYNTIYNSNTRHFFFTQRVPEWWNKLLKEVIDAPSVNAFKNRWNNHSENHPVKYNYRALDNPVSPQMMVSWRRMNGLSNELESLQNRRGCVWREALNKLWWLFNDGAGCKGIISLIHAILMYLLTNSPASIMVNICDLQRHV